MSSPSFHREAKRQSARGRCLHYGDGVRCNKIIAAHSIQKGGQLSLIAEDGHVYRLNADLSTLNRTDGLPHPKKAGVNQASTFAGFCKYHDNALFKPIDTRPLAPDKQQAALYAYRSLCREFFVKENAVNVLEAVKADPNLDEAKRAHVESSLIGHSLGFEGLKYHKHYYDEALRKNDFDEFDFIYFGSKSRCSLQLSGLIYPDFDFIGSRLQDLGDWSSPLELLTFFTAPTTDGWAFGFAWHATSARACTLLVESLASRASEEHWIQDALLRFAFSCCENHAFRISWWNGMSNQSQRAILERMLLMAHPNLPVPSNYLATGCEGIADWSYEYVHTSLSTDA
ncbi:MAG: hypothetical protein ACREBW_01180 [Candidatus Micrarchaeaceae archaeon]